jgi:CheY-like chemotaxis protein
MSDKRVLVVDDSKDIGRMLAAALGTLDPGVQVKMMSSAEEAVLEITRATFDLLVIDIRLPGISGLDLTRRIRSRNPNLKIIQISGLDDPQVPNEALSAGANAFFHKPISMSEFLKTTAVYLGLRTVEPEVQVSADFQSEAQSGKMADVLTAARKAVNALAVVLTDGHGHLVVQAGKLPDPNLETSLIPELLEALFASAKVGVRIGELQPEHVLGFRGPAFHVLVAPIYAGYALIIFLPAEKPSLRMAIAFEEAMAAQQELYHLILGAGQPAGEEAKPAEVTPPAKVAAAPVNAEPNPAVSYSPPPALQPKPTGRVSAPTAVFAVPVQAPILPQPTVVQPEVHSPAAPVEASRPVDRPKPEPAPSMEQKPIKPEVKAMEPASPASPAVTSPEPVSAPAPAASHETLEESLDSLLRASADRRLERNEIDAFWDDLTAQDNGEASESSDMISYEQAIKMGLAPKSAGK